MVETKKLTLTLTLALLNPTHRSRYNSPVEHYGAIEFSLEI